MITYKTNIDGLPGVTMPGIKGDTGNRGAMTFYSTDTSTNYDLSYKYSLGFISDSSVYTISYDPLSSTADSSILSIYNNGVKLELYDNILVNETSGTVQYQVVDIVSISSDDISEYTETPDSSGLAANKTAVLNYLSITPAVNGIETVQIESVADEILSDAGDTNTVKLIKVLSSTLSDTDNVFEAYVLTKLDVWEYNSTASGDYDYTVSFSLKEVGYDAWDGYYQKTNSANASWIFETLFDGGGCANPSLDNDKIKNLTRTKLNEIKDKFDVKEDEYRKTHDITSLQDFFVMTRSIFNDLFDPGDFLLDITPVKFYLKAVSSDDLYGDSTPVKNIDMYIQYFTFDGSKIGDPLSAKISDIIFADNSLDSKGKTDETGAWSGDGLYRNNYNYGYSDNIFFIDESQDQDDPNYTIKFIGYILANALTGIEPEVCSMAWTPYAKHYKTDDETGATYMDMYAFLRAGLGSGSGVDITSLKVSDSIPVYSTNKAGGTASSGISVIQIDVKNSVNETDAANYKIVLEFMPNNNGMFIFDTQSVIPDLWKEETDYDRLIDSMAHGNIKNYSRTLNFDNESPGQFTYVIKDYNDENNGMNTFSKMLYIPSYMVESYTAHLYIYSKTSASSADKTYLGTVTF